MKKQYTLEGLDGNAFNIMGYVYKCLNYPLTEEYRDKAFKAKDYQELLCISQDYIDLANGVKK